jgi:hypothetical protein
MDAREADILTTRQRDSKGDGKSVSAILSFRQ